MKTDIIKKRQRYESNSATVPTGRKSSSKKQKGDTTNIMEESPEALSPSFTPMYTSNFGNEFNQVTTGASQQQQPFGDYY